MRDYAKVTGAFWTGKTGKALRGDPAAQVLAMYLITSGHSNMIGVYYCPVLFMAHETGLDLEGASKALQRLSEVGFCTYEESSEHVWVHEMAKYQVDGDLKPSDNRVAGIRKQFSHMPAGRIKSGFYAKYRDAFHLGAYVPPADETDAHISPLGAPSKPGAGTGAETGTGAGVSRPPASPPPAPNGNEGEQKETALQAACKATWKAYAEAYFDRYGVEPVRNATVNAQVKNFVRRIPYDESPLIAAWYVRHPKAFYVGKSHDFGSLLKDAESLRTEWATNRHVTATAAQQSDRTASNFQASQDALAILQAKGLAA